MSRAFTSEEFLFFFFFLLNATETRMESVKFISRKLSRPSLYFVVTLALRAVARREILLGRIPA